MNTPIEEIEFDIQQTKEDINALLIIEKQARFLSQREDMNCSYWRGVMQQAARDAWKGNQVLAKMNQVLDSYTT